MLKKAEEKKTRNKDKYICKTKVRKRLRKSERKDEKREDKKNNKKRLSK